MSADIYALIIFLILIAGFGGAIVAFSALIGRLRAPAERLVPYECGLDPAEEQHSRFSVKFFLVAVLFIIFDVEIIFLYPWALAFRDAVSTGGGIFLMAEVVVFLAIIALALLYAWGKGALEWEE